MFGLFKKKGGVKIVSPMTGAIKELSEVPDPVFADKLLGDGVGILPTDGRVVAPCDGKIVQIFPTNHAVGMETNEGLELLIHVGIDTVELNGEGFTRLAEVGSEVTAGTPLLEVDLKLIAEKGKSLVTPCIITNMDKVDSISFNSGDVEAGSEIMTIKLKK